MANRGRKTSALHVIIIDLKCNNYFQTFRCSHPAYCTAVYREWRYQMLL